MAFNSLWARVTGPDKEKAYPDQQVSALGRSGDSTIIYPYGTYCNLPDDSLVRVIGEGVALSAAVSRPDDLERGEPAHYHPETNTRIIPRNNGDLDIICDDGDAKGNINIHVIKANITASSELNIDTPNANFTGNVSIANNLTVVGSTAMGSTVTSDGTNISNTHKHDGSASAPSGAISPTGNPV